MSKFARLVIVVSLLMAAACGGDDDNAGVSPDASGETDSTPSDTTPSDQGSTDADEADAADGASADDGAAGPTDGEDMIDTILRDFGLSGEILSSEERSCVNDELAASVGTLPDDLSLNNTELWDAVNAAAQACGAEIGL